MNPQLQFSDELAEAVADVDVEIEITAEDGVNLTTGERWKGLRTRYRFAGERRWRKFLVVSAPGQSLLDLVSAAIAAIAVEKAKPR